jgi:hypothetical protein
MEIVVNRCFGGFSLSHEAIEKYLELKGWHYTKVKSEFRLIEYDYEVKECPDFYDREIVRNDPILVQVVKLLGDKANGDYAELQIVEIPDDVNWEIEEYDGREWVAEKHRTW